VRRGRAFLGVTLPDVAAPPGEVARTAQPWSSIRNFAPAVATAVVLAAVVGLLGYAAPGRPSRHPALLSPQENTRFHLAQEWVRHGRPVRPLAAFARLPADVAPALTPRDAALQGGEVVPKDFPYSLALVALLELIDPLPLFVGPASAIALVAATAALASSLGTSQRAGWVAATLLATTSAFTAGSTGLLTTGATLALSVVIAALLLCPPVGVAGARLGAPRRDTAAGLALGVAVGLHHDAVFLAAGLFLAFSLPRFGGSPRRAAPLAGGALLALVPVLVYNSWLFGSPVLTGYGVGERFFDANFADNTAGVFDVRLDLLLEHVRRYLVRPDVLLLLVGAVVAVLSSRPGRNSTARTLVLGLVVGGVPYMAFAGSRPLYGEGSFTVGASFLRYALPVVSLLVALAASCPEAMPRRLGQLGAISLLLAAVIGAVSVATSPGGPADQRRQALRTERLRDGVLAASDANSLIVTARGDKFLWPERSTIVAAYLVREPEQGIHRGAGLYDTVPTLSRLTEVLSRLVTRGETVYVLDDGWLADREALDSHLRAGGSAGSPPRNARSSGSGSSGHQPHRLHVVDLGVVSADTVDGQTAVTDIRLHRVLLVVLRLRAAERHDRRYALDVERVDTVARGVTNAHRDRIAPVGDHHLPRCRLDLLQSWVPPLHMDEGVTTLVDARPVAITAHRDDVDGIMGPLADPAVGQLGTLRWPGARAERLAEVGQIAGRGGRLCALEVHFHRELGRPLARSAGVAAVARPEGGSQCGGEQQRDAGKEHQPPV